MSKKKGFPWLAAGAAVGGMGIFYYLLLKDRENQDGRDLWSALGFPYGPIGNLPAMGADFRTGKKAMPVPGALNLGVLLSHQLTDTVGSALTDTLGVALTDVFAPTSPTLTTSRNAAGINDTFRHSGGGISWPTQARPGRIPPRSYSS